MIQKSLFAKHCPTFKKGYDILVDKIYDRKIWLKKKIISGTIKLIRDSTESMKIWLDVIISEGDYAIDAFCDAAKDKGIREAILKTLIKLLDDKDNRIIRFAAYGIEELAQKYDIVSTAPKLIELHFNEDPDVLFRVNMAIYKIIERATMDDLTYITRELKQAIQKVEDEKLPINAKTKSNLIFLLLEINRRRNELLAPQIDIQLERIHAQTEPEQAVYRAQMQI